ncbi:MAG: bifunctional phosphoribosylaminoimidazolecarboxamide formyltransferase/IMP cyclohydrolase [Spirochaetes bacterium]|nr:bifunctional phosphoribosylaminoimidazolecarboxamide formyltransferase/IMP cyclohydrolase [Spirochaetota bacterium]
MKVQTALISVYDKTGIVPFARELHKLGVKIMSTGGTANLLIKNNIPVVKLESYTGLPEILDGRVKTLCYKVFGGLLAMRDNKEHVKQMEELQINSIDMVVVNLYPFEKMMKKKGLSLDEMIEYIDIGGNSLLRASAKNYKFVLPIFSSKFYNDIIKLLKEKKDVPFEYRLNLAKETFLFTSYYDNLIHQYLSEKTEKTLYPANKTLFLKKMQNLRYGENPHQNASLYSIKNSNKIQFKQLHGKELSFNNIVDFYATANACAELDKYFKKTACVIVKHRNPCGAALSDSVSSAYSKALQGDPVSAYGGIIAVNKKMDLKTAKQINTRFYEIVVAKDYESSALKELKKKKNLRILKIADYSSFLKKNSVFNSYGNLLLVQDKDNELFTELKTVTKKKTTPKDIEELKFAWIICKHVKSNAIIFTKNMQVCGIGAGQMSRIDSTNFAAIKAKQAGLSLKDAYLASDAYFPFKDSIALAAKYNIKAVIQPGGSIRDEEVVQEADKKKISMVYTAMRHFNH